MDDPRLWAALIAAIGSVIVSVFSLLTASFARSRVLALEDGAKQTELIRAKGLDALEEIIFAIGKVPEVVRTMALTRDNFPIGEGLYRLTLLHQPT